MQAFDAIRLIVFGLLSALVLTGAVWVATLKNLFRAALSLGMALVGTAGLFLLMGAEFLAFVQVLVYVGAVLTMVIFAIMLTGRLQTTPDEPVPGSKPVAAIASAALFVVLTAATWGVEWPSLDGAEPITVAAIGQQMVTTLVLPFEVVSLVFAAVMIGAMVLAGDRGLGAAAERGRGSAR